MSNAMTPPVSDERWRISALPAYKIESYDNMKEKLQKNSIEMEILRAENETLKGDIGDKEHQLRRARAARNGSKSPNRVALSPRPARTPQMDNSFESHFTNNEPRRQTMGVPTNARYNQRWSLQQMDLLQMIYSQATQMEDNIREIDSQKETVGNFEIQTEDLQRQLFYMMQSKDSQQQGESNNFEGTNSECLSVMDGNDWDGNIEMGRISLEVSPREDRGDFESPYNKINMLDVDQVAGTGDF
jgi:hypothetical protein